MKKEIHILLVDDHQVVRDGLQHMLEQEEDMQVVGDCASAQDALFLAGIVLPNIIIADIKMPGVDGIELTRQLRQKYPSCNVIMLTLYDQYLTQAMEAGARGYLLKDVKREELTGAIRQVHSGKIVTSESIRPKTKFDYEDRHAKRAEAGSNTMVEEIHLVLSPPVEASQLMRLSGRIEEALQCRVLQMIGAWQEGTVMTIALKRVTSLAEILSTFREIPEVEAVTEELPRDNISRKLIKKAEAIPRLTNKISKTIFLTLEKN